MMLRHSFGLAAIAAKIELSVNKAVKDNIRTIDIAFGAQSVSTSEMGEAIIQRL